MFKKQWRVKWLETRTHDLKAAARRRHSVSVCCCAGCTVTTRCLKPDTLFARRHERRQRFKVTDLNHREPMTFWLEPVGAPPPLGFPLSTGGGCGGQTAGPAPLINSSFKRIPLRSAAVTLPYKYQTTVQNTPQIPIAEAKPRFKSAWKRSNNRPPIASRAIKSLGVDESRCLSEMKSRRREETRKSSTYPPPSRAPAYC